MPAEVFTISGPPGFGALGPGAMVTPNALQAAAARGAGGVSPPVLLQNALKALGTTAGDGLLSAVKVDGAIGPATVKAVNHALANYVGATPKFPRANLTVVAVRQNAGGLAALVVDRVRKSGGVVPDPVLARRSSGGGGGDGGAAAAAAAAAAEPPTAGPGPPKWIWWTVGGIALLVLVGAFTARRRRATA